MILQMDHKEHGISLVEISTFANSKKGDIAVIARQTGCEIEFTSEMLKEFNSIDVMKDDGDLIYHVRLAS